MMTYTAFGYEISFPFEGERTGRGHGSTYRGIYSVCVCVCICICICLCIIYVYVCVYMCVCIYVYVCVCVYIYISAGAGKGFKGVLTTSESSMAKKKISKSETELLD